MQRALSLIYPNQCVLCTQLVDGAGALCGGCWGEIDFLSGHVCDLCGAKLQGASDGASDLCDDCLVIPRPWRQGRAVFSYHGAGRRLVLALKHADRTDLAVPAAAWMARSGAPILKPDVLLVPVPSHWTRLLSRRYNQAAEIARALSALTGLSVETGALVRPRKTLVQEGMGVEQRFQNLDNAIAPHRKHGAKLENARVCLIDDVMTSGATFAAATRACLQAGASEIFVLALARVEKSS